MSAHSNYQAIIASPLGPLGIISRNEALCRIDFLPENTALSPPADAAARRAAAQLRRYFGEPGWSFSLPLRPAGTPFQQSVWRQLQQIPAGQTRSYGHIARALDSGPRAVGNACRANPLPIVIPCHRVVAANGPGGYAGRTEGRNMEIKRWLLAHEGITP